MTTKHDRAAIEATLRAIALGCPPADVKFGAAMVLLQNSQTTIDRLTKIPVEQGGLELRHDGRSRLITYSSIQNRIAMRGAGKRLPVRKRTAAEKEREAEKLAAKAAKAKAKRRVQS